MPPLRSSLGTVPLVALGTAGVIGSSWIYTGSEFFSAYDAGGEILGLALATVFVSCIALAYGELASAFPRAGGEVVFGYVAFNRGVAFAAGWLLTGAYVSSLAFYVTSLGALLGDVVPGMATVALYTVNGTTVHLPVLALGVTVAVFVFAVNWRGVSPGAWAQFALFAVMLTIGLVLAAVGFGHGTAGNAWPLFSGGLAESAGRTARFVLPAMTFLTGFSLVTVLAEDSRVPPRRLGRVILVTVGLAGAFYCLVLLATAWVIPWQRTASLDRGTIDAFLAAGFPALGWAAYTVAVLGLVTSFLGLFVATSRIVLAMGRAGLLPSGLARLHPRYGTPTRALVFTLAVVLGLGWLGEGALTWFLDTGGVYVGLAWVLGVASMYRVRRTYPHLDPPFRARPSAAPALGAVLATCVIAFTLWPGTGMSLVWPWEHAILLAWAALGVALYARTRRADDDAALRTLLGSRYDTLTTTRRE
ncbi:amino acid/polyamine/organocation transporter (APC superfamily) [Haloactinospora alba]|uniref:Amino acid/polyamine/organocation transporter (APC superfamily) n=1 Tax=Haloactinospora alba TaxID=405555 RepID=A0A543NNK0_9ACTN|nr:APC family permease [Haloactinospora alba]TQN33402.1 amino acid/polyamine/organocation transporter (APC superfamily) [Haloactinospora alba]